MLTTPERLRVLERLERMARQLRAPQHPLINQLDAQAGQEELGGTLRCALADRLRITKAEAARRIDEAADLWERRALTGEPLAPQLPATATAQRDGEIGDGHIKVIRSFFAHLPTEVDLPTREAADADLAHYARQYRPDELAKYAQRIMDWLNPDGDFTDEQRARKRGITIGREEYDGMSRISGYPDDETPVVDQTTDQDALRRDTRSTAQRNHDGLLAALRGLLCSGDLGQHNGLPVSIVVTTTLQELQAAAGKALTGGGSWVSMSDLIRMASRATTSPFSMTVRPWRCITRKGWRPRRSESCSTPRIVGVRSWAATPPPTTAKPTTCEGGRLPAAPTSVVTVRRFLSVA